MTQPELTKQEKEVVITVLNDATVAVRNANYVLNIIAKLEQQVMAEVSSGQEPTIPDEVRDPSLNSHDASVTPPQGEAALPDQHPSTA